MDISRTRVVLRERAVVDVLDLGVRFVAQHWAAYAKMSGVVLVPFYVASWLIARASPAGAWLFSVFAMSLAGAPFTVLASRLVFEQEVHLRAILATCLRAAPRLVVLRIAIVTIAALGFSMILPGVAFLVLALFVVEVAILERAGLFPTWTRSSRMVLRESGHAVIASMLLAFAHLFTVLAVDVSGRLMIMVLLESHAPDAVWDRGWSALALAGFWLFLPYAATARFFVYLDVRTRSEGWDIQTRFTAIASRPAEDARIAA